MTEMITGVDIIKEQILIAAGEKLQLPARGYPDSGDTPSSAALTPRTRDNFMPSPGVITQFHPAGGPGIRLDTHIYNGYRVPPYYDSMIGKLIASRLRP